MKKAILTFLEKSTDNRATMKAYFRHDYQDEIKVSFSMIGQTTL